MGWLHGTLLRFRSWVFGLALRAPVKIPLTHMWMPVSGKAAHTCACRCWQMFSLRRPLCRFSHWTPLPGRLGGPPPCLLPGQALRCWSFPGWCSRRSRECDEHRGAGCRPGHRATAGQPPPGEGEQSLRSSGEAHPRLMEPSQAEVTQRPSVRAVRPARVGLCGPR